MSQPPKTMSSSVASGTKSLIAGARPSVRLPRRMVPSCVSDPIGSDFFRRTRSTPAMNVVATAPMPTVRTPSFPFGKAMPADLRIRNSPVIFQMCGTLNRRAASIHPSREPRFPVRKQRIMRERAKICNADSPTLAHHISLSGVRSHEPDPNTNQDHNCLETENCPVNDWFVLPSKPFKRP